MLPISRRAPPSSAAFFEPRRLDPGLILHNGRLLTMDPANPRAEAAAIAGDRFLAVGGLCAYVNSLAFEIDSSIRWLKTSAKFARPADRDASVKAFLAGKAIYDQRARESRR